MSALDPVSMSYIRTNSGPANLFPATPNIPNAWIYSTRIVDMAGHALSTQYLKTTCPILDAGTPTGPRQNFPTQGPAAARAALRDCVAIVGLTYHQVVTYQPASRYWAFQWYELAIFLAAAVILAGVSIWWVRRSLS
jgi:hypothetical protein